MQVGQLYQVQKNPSNIAGAVQQFTRKQHKALDLELHISIHIILQKSS